MRAVMPDPNHGGELVGEDRRRRRLVGGAVISYFRQQDPEAVPFLEAVYPKQITQH